MKQRLREHWSTHLRSTNADLAGTGTGIEGQFNES
jgi:hypothetical protein